VNKDRDDSSLIRIRRRSGQAVVLLAIAEGCTSASGNNATAPKDDASMAAESQPDPCRLDSTVSCTTPALGYTCAGANSPSAALTCSPPSPGGDAGTSVYCCFQPTTCETDSNVTGCPAGWSGYSCAGTDTPSEDDSTLTCGVAYAGDAGATTYCCASPGAPDGSVAAGDADTDTTASEPDADATIEADAETKMDSNLADDSSTCAAMASTGSAGCDGCLGSQCCAMLVACDTAADAGLNDAGACDRLVQCRMSSCSSQCP
jgi:hypothetical protein